jgi:hypothetical protein
MLQICFHGLNVSSTVTSTVQCGPVLYIIIRMCLLIVCAVCVAIFVYLEGGWNVGGKKYCNCFSFIGCNSLCSTCLNPSKTELYQNRITFGGYGSSQPDSKKLGRGGGFLKHYLFFRSSERTVRTKN